MKKLLALLLSALLSLTAVGALAEEAPLEFSYMTISSDTWNSEQLPMVELQARTNTQIDFITAPLDGYATNLQTMLATGDIPDVIQVRDKAQLSMLVDQGAILPIEDLLKEYGQNILAVVGEANYNAVRDADGHIYTIPFVGTTPLTKSWMMRKDWLDRLSLEVPTTWDEWVEVFKAFKEQDANGNGDPNDEIPFTAMDTSLLYTFDIAANDIFCVDPENHYTLIYEHPNYQAYLETLRDLYAQGLLDPEYLDRTGDTKEAALTAAMANDLVGCCWTFMNNMHHVDAIEGAQYIYMAPPVSPYGTQTQPGRVLGVSDNAATISVAAEDKAIALIQFFDYIFSEEGRLLFSFGVEGVHFDYVDGEPRLRPEYTTDFNTYRAQGMNYQPIAHVWTGDAYVQVFTNGATFEEMDSVAQQFTIGAEKNEEYGIAVPPIFTTEAYSEYYADLGAQVKSLEANTVAGNITVEEFFAEYEKLKEEGLQEVIDQADEAWQAIQ